LDSLRVVYVGGLVKDSMVLVTGFTVLGISLVVLMMELVVVPIKVDKNGATNGINE